MSRRSVLGAAGAVAVGGLAGCLGDDGQARAPTPTSLGGGQTCDNCGMVIGEHHGPNGQIFFEANGPEDHGNPARFDSLAPCLFPYYFSKRDLGWTAARVYVTDYAVLDYAVETREGEPYLSSHTQPDSFAAADGLLYVVESRLQGAMGPDLVPFSRRSQAESLVDE